MFDNDVVTGRTLQRAYHEIARLEPAFVDVLLMYKYTRVDSKRFKQWNTRFCMDDAVISTDRQGNPTLDTYVLIPPGVREVCSIETDYSHDYEAFKEFRELMLEDMIEEELPYVTKRNH
ncbi:hypothetical protein COT72_01965 [archaeon CG10_big_fil_rev_8_21_14_0_10_43_11]|nr:MAG: hypothetical protein COT72_01965 [archaeon CG10_big_fil_rev_8_21_14_0_10_43_11]